MKTRDEMRQALLTSVKRQLAERHREALAVGVPLMPARVALFTFSPDLLIDLLRHEAPWCVQFAGMPLDATVLATQIRLDPDWPGRSRVEILLTSRAFDPVSNDDPIPEHDITIRINTHVAGDA